MSDWRHGIAAADAKADRRRGGGPKKSSRSFPRSTAGVAADDGGDAPRSVDATNDCIGGPLARAEYPSTNAPSKDARLETGVARSREGAKRAKRGTHRLDTWGVGGVGARAEEDGTEGLRIHHQRQADGQEMGGFDYADQLIQDKWKTKASPASGGIQRSNEPRPHPEDNPAIIMKGDGYDDEGFEDYSDEFENEEDDRDEQPSVVRHSRAMTHGKSILADCARPSKSPVVSPALKMRQTEHLQAPDNKALLELRHSLQEENNMARERKIAKPASSTLEAFPVADTKDPLRVVNTRAKSSKSLKSVDAQGKTGMAKRGKDLEDASADDKHARSFTAAAGRSRSSNFKMADAKALTQVLAKAVPRTERGLAIRAYLRLEMESTRLFDQPPFTQIDLYHRRLRAQPAVIRQVASQTNEDPRSVEVQTQEVILVDKEVQFHLGHDDTTLENLMRRLRSGRRSSLRRANYERGEDNEEKSATENHGVLSVNSEEDPGHTSAVKDTDHVGEALSGRPMHARAVGDIVQENLEDDPPNYDVSVAPQPQRLGMFLRKVCVVMEALCEENLSSAAARGSLERGEPAEEDDKEIADGKRSLFFGGDYCGGWEEVGADSSVVAPGERARSDASGVGSLLNFATVVGVAFSYAKRSTLVTAHARLARHKAMIARDDDGSERDVAAEMLEGCGTVCVWNTDNPKVNVVERDALEEGRSSKEEAPVTVLFGEGVFTCLCLALSQPYVILVGTGEGCMLLWDLRDPARTSHTQAQKLGLKCGLRPPTYTTAGGGAGLGGPALGHFSAIVSIVSIPTSSGGDGAGGGDLGEMLSLAKSQSFQVASLDDHGTVSIWVVTETAKADEGGLQTDLGLRPGGRVRLTLSKSLRMDTDLKDHEMSPWRFAPASFNSAASAGIFATAPAATARALAFSPEDPNRFLVSSTCKRIVHASRLGDSPSPREFRAPRPLGTTAPGRIDAGTLRDARSRENEQGMGGISCLSFSPFFRRHFLAGCGDGSVRLYREDCGVPLNVWEGFSSREHYPRDNERGEKNLTRGDHFGDWPTAIFSVAWSEHRPAVFFVLDMRGTLYAFDLLDDGVDPVASARRPTCGASGRENRGTIDDSERKVRMEGEDTSSRGAVRRMSAANAREGGDVEDVAAASSSPMFSLSSETLATGSRPKVALAVDGRIFTRHLSRSMFRPAEDAREEGLKQQGMTEGRCCDGLQQCVGVVSEIKRMEQWLEAMLWA